MERYTVEGELSKAGSGPPTAGIEQPRETVDEARDEHRGRRGAALREV
ncbi:MAG: hypothetical protein J4G12_04790 [Gemmatimonadetes bacterium]|nr:hypothetical protein [Gemmatimonadota bacterium]